MKLTISIFLILVLACCNGNDITTQVKNNQPTTASEDETKSKYEFQVEDACGFDKSMVNETVYSFDSDREAESALKRVMRLTGLPANFEIRAASVPNAAAVIKCDRNGNNCNRYILYNQEFMEKVKDETKTNYAELAILSHEIAHHLSGHTISNTGSSYDMELEADKFAGFMLYKMGASIGETKQSFSNLPIQGSSIHPPRSARIAAVTNGWYDAKRNGETITPPTTSQNNSSSNQEVEPKKAPVKTTPKKKEKRKLPRPNYQFIVRRCKTYLSIENENRLELVNDNKSIVHGFDILGDKIRMYYLNPENNSVVFYNEYKIRKGKTIKDNDAVTYKVYLRKGKSNLYSDIKITTDGKYIYVLDYKSYTPKDDNPHDGWSPATTLTHHSTRKYYIE